MRGKSKKGRLLRRGFRLSSEREKKMKYAIIKLNANNHEIKGKTVNFKTIFGDVPVTEAKVKLDEDIAKVPLWCFGANGLNPCQMVSGFMGITK